jgi:hypothetical protein
VALTLHRHRRRPVEQTLEVNTALAVAEVIDFLLLPHDAKESQDALAGFSAILKSQATQRMR